MHTAMSLPLKQRWAHAYRDNEFYAAVDTNNGTEAQNKVLKYKYMPKQRASTLSALVCLLVERFLPFYIQFYRRMPNKEGIVLQPQGQRQVINMRWRVWKAKAALRCSSLPSLRCKKRAPCSYRNRFGIKADCLRKANQEVSSLR